MSENLANAPGRQTARRGRRRLFAGFLLAGTFVVGAFVVWFYVLGPQPPEIALFDDEPHAARDIAEARANVELWPFRSSKWGRLGIVMGHYGRHREAVLCFARAAQLSPSSPRWPLLQGICHAQLRDYGAAEKAFREALQLKPDSLEVLSGLASALEEQEHFSAAAEQLRRALAFEPDAETLHYRLCRCLANQDDRAGAIEVLRDALRRKPDALRLHHDLAFLLADDGRAVEAREVLERALELAPENRKSQVMLDRLVEASEETNDEGTADHAARQ